MLDKNISPGLKEDHWKQTSGKIMIGNGISWTLIISINYVRNKQREYYVRRMEVQPELLELIRDIPICTGLRVRRDIKGIEEFYSIISGKDVEMLGFIDLNSLAIAAGYKL